MDGEKLGKDFNFFPAKRDLLLIHLREAKTYYLYKKRGKQGAICLSL